MGGVEEKDGEYEVWKNSGIGDYVDVVAPAEGIWVERPSYRTRRPWPGLVDGNSLAASIVSGCAALILSAMDKQTVNYLKQTAGGLNEAIRAILCQTASNEKFGFLTPNSHTGYGMIDITKAIRLARTWIFQRECP